MFGIKKSNIFLAIWVTLPTFFSYASYFFPRPLKVFLIAPAGLFTLSVLFYFVLSFLPKPKFNFIPETRILIALFVILVFGLLYTHAFTYGTNKIVFLSTWVILFYVYSSVIVNNFRTFAKGSLFCGIVFLFLLFSEFGDPISFFKSMQGETIRLGIEQEGVFTLNPIWVARYLGFLFLMALYLLDIKRGKNLLYAYLLLLFLYMITSGSKGPIYALIGACMIYFASSKMSVNIKSISIFVAIFAGMFLLLNAMDFFSSSFYISRFSERSSSGLEREGYIDAAFQFRGIFSFLFGTGTGNFGFFLNQRDLRAYPHNITAELFYENGAVALFVLFLMYYSVFKKHALILKHKELRLLCANFFYFGLNSMFSGDLFSNEYFFIFFILFHCEVMMIKRAEKIEILLASQFPQYTYAK